MLRLKKKTNHKKAGGSSNARPPQDIQKPQQKNTEPIKGPLTLPLNATGKDQTMKPASDDSSMAPPQIHFHPVAKELINDYIFNELPINLLHLSRTEKMEMKMEICSQWKVWGHVETIMKKLETARDVPSNLRDSEKEPNLTDIVAFVNDKVKWAIFSHRWTQPNSEPDYQEVKENKLLDSKPGHQKLRNFCEVAHRKHGVEFVWTDTCCINTKDNSEYVRSIRSMYRWYANAPICIVHLAKTVDVGDLGRDEWFTRGWTLQELLAPKKLKFYNKNWRPLTDLENDKYSEEITAQVERATTITPYDLRHFSPNSQKYEISKRMRWAARRETTVPEDGAYCLMGIFSVSLNIDPGEGRESALWRLMEQILRFSNSPEVLNWAGVPTRQMSLSSSAFPSRIACFTDSKDPGTFRRDDEALAMTPRGLRVDLLVLTANVVAQDKGSPALQALGCKLVTPEVLGGRDGDRLQNEGFQYAFGIWNFHSSPGKCGLNTSSNGRLEALLLSRQIDTANQPETKWAKVSTKHFIRLEGVQEQKWEQFRESVWV